MSEEVEYRELEQYPGYRVGSDGTVWTEWKAKGTGYGGSISFNRSGEWRQLKQEVDHRNRCRVRLRYDKNKYRKRFVCNLVLEAFISPRPEKLECCHWDGNSSNNNLNNLRWDTHESNKNDNLRLGVIACGENHPSTKLTKKQVLKIRYMYDNGKRPTDIAKLFNISITYVCDLGERRSWRHLPN